MTSLSVQNLSKLYQLNGTTRGGYRTFRESICEAVAVPWRGLRYRLRRPHAPGAVAASAPDDVWALKDVSFDVKSGEVVGIVGRNGAGKSTLLKILSRITNPSRGRIRMLGRVGSLLEVGTGFHPELTGR